MGFTLGRQLREQFIPREWAWYYSKTDGTKVYRAVGSSTSDNPPGETLSDWEGLDDSDERGVDPTDY